MYKELLQHFRRYIPIDPEDEAMMSDFFRPAAFAKRENLVEVNTRCKRHFFVIKGCLRMFFVDDKGVEHTIQFAIENWWLTDYLAFNNQTQTQFSIQAVENSDILYIDHSDQEKLCSSFPRFERYFRMIYQRAYAASQLRTRYLYDFSREQFYHHFNDSFPEFTHRIPQHLLASYLNMTPEYLSEIKKKART